MKCKQARTYVKKGQATATNPMTFAVFGAGEINTRRLSDARISCEIVVQT